MHHMIMLSASICVMDADSISLMEKTIHLNGRHDSLRSMDFISGIGIELSSYIFVFDFDGRPMAHPCLFY